MPARRAAVPVRRKHSEDEVLLRWSGLSLEQRKAVMSFDDVVLVGRIRSALQALFEKHTVMQQLCANLGCEDTGTADPFEASVLLKQAFEFTWGIARMADDPSVVMVNAGATPVMVMKVGFLQEAQRLIGNMKNVLPDFLSQQASRVPLPKARWKDLWSIEPSSMIALEQLLAKLAEQALWAMACDESLVAHSIEEDVSLSELSLEPWMTEHDQEVVRARDAASRASKKKKKRQRPLVATLRAEPSIEVIPTQESDTELDMEGGALAEDEYTLLSSTQEDSTRFSETQFDDRMDHVVDSFSEFCVEEIGDHEKESGDQEDVADEPCYLKPPSTPSSSPCFSRHWQPPQLVNYIWSHTSQMSVDRQDSELAPPSSSSASGIASTRTPESRDSVTHGTPWHRGQWILSTQAPATSPGKTRAFVRNTFIDIDRGDDSKIKASRSSRSLSPSFSTYTRQAAAPPVTDQWQWYWH